MRRLLFLAAAVLSACGNPTSSTPASTTQATVAASTTQTAATNAAASQPIWFFCDGIDTPVVYLFADPPNDNRTRFIEYDKRTGATVRSIDLQLGEGDGAAGSTFVPLLQNGQEFGRVRQANTGNFENPSAAYTLAYADVQIGDHDVECRWLPRTRVAAFTGRRSFVIHEDADGDLIYTTFDFANAATQPIDQGDNGRSTRFSVEVRGGQEQVRPGGSDFTFPGRDGFSYHVALKNDGSGQLQVLRNGAQVQAEALTAYIVGQASED